jgi:cytoskeletal protein RodZ
MAAERPTGDFGGKLRQARERRGISLRQIANATKISVVALEALERNDVSRLPGGIFSRAFVRSYAVEIGLDPEQTIQEFLAQFPHDSVTAGHPQAGQIEVHDTHESDRRTATTWLGLIAVSVPIAGVVLYFTTGRQPAPEPAPDPVPVAAAAPEPPPLPPPPAPIAESDAGLPGAAPIDSAASDTPSDVLSVNLLATRECWVSATVDGTKVIDRLLQAGERTTMEIRRELVLTTGDAAALSLTLNGADARSLGAIGEVVTTTLSLGNYRDFLSP